MKIQLKAKPKTDISANKKGIVSEPIIVPISSVQLWKDNPRKNEDAAKKLAEILKIHGQVTPIVVWKKNNVVYKGNTTLKAMKMNGETTVKVIPVDFPSEAAAIAYALDDNKSSEFAQWDDSVLSSLMKAQDLSSVLKGFTEKELEGIGAVSGFAAGNYAEAMAEFQARIKNKKNPLWFWFEVPDQEAFDFVKENLGRTEGKRLHRELDWNKLKKYVVEG